MRSKNGIGRGTGSVGWVRTLSFAFVLGGVVAASGCDHVHWLGILDAGGGSTNDGSVSDVAWSDVAWSEAGNDGSNFPEAAASDGGTGAAGCPAACAAIMGCGLGGYGPYRAGVGYAYAYVIGPYAYATGYSMNGNEGYGAYGFRDLEYQQCVVTCETYSDCLGCGPASERDRIVSCVLANTCPALLDCMVR